MDRYALLVERLEAAILKGKGDTQPALRQAVEARSAQLGGRPGAPAGELPADLKVYVDKVALHAYKVTDEDVAALLTAGYSEDAVFEVTVSAALGAATSRLEIGLAALKGSAR
jgi:hypothetical protein